MRRQARPRSRQPSPVPNPAPNQNRTRPQCRSWWRIERSRERWPRCITTVNLAPSEPEGTQRGGDCAGDFEAFEDSLVIHLAYTGIDGRWKMEDFWTWDEHETWLEQNAQESG